MDQPSPWRDYLIADGKRIGQRTKVDSNPAEFRYFVQDHLGSIVSIINASGASAVVEKHFSYDPWGKDRDPLTGADDPSRIYPFSPADSPTSRGFSDHEKLPGTGLINMNARLYDPEIGRFLSADSVTQSIYVSVALNRYAYCGNNPLSYTDPTGHLFGIDDIFGWVAVGLGIFSFFSDDPWIDTLAAIAIGWQFGPYGSWQLANEGASALVGGLIAGGVTSGGNVKSALIGAGSAYAFHLVGGPIKEGLHIREGSAATFGERLASAGLHGMVGGLVSVAQGGKFASGFISAGFSNLAGSYSPFGEGAGTLAYVAIVGGISSELGGGKFANGAVTAAFGYLYNECASNNCGTKYSNVSYAEFNGTSLSFYDADGNLIKSFPAVSGKPGVTDESEPWEGPIPTGTYDLDPSDISEVRGVDYLLRQVLGDWGNYRVTLAPQAGTNTFGRDGFFLHDGLRQGSAGCIDVAGFGTEVFDVLRQIGHPIEIRVQYPESGPPRWWED